MNIKKFLIGVSVGALMLGASITPALAVQGVVLDNVNFATQDDTCNLTSSVNGILPVDSWGPTTAGGYYGGRQAESCVVWEADSSATNEAIVTLVTPQGAAKSLKVAHLDGIADDSFDVYVKHANGEWVKAGSYADQGNDSEVWHTDSYDLTGITLGRGRDIPVKIVVTANAWGGRATWGQLAIDSISLLGNGRPR